MKTFSTRSWLKIIILRVWQRNNNTVKPPNSGPGFGDRECSVFWGFTVRYYDDIDDMIRTCSWRFRRSLLLCLDSRWRPLIRGFVRRGRRCRPQPPTATKIGPTWPVNNTPRTYTCATVKTQSKTWNKKFKKNKPYKFLPASWWRFVVYIIIRCRGYSVVAGMAVRCVVSEDCGGAVLYIIHTPMSINARSYRWGYYYTCLVFTVMIIIMEAVPYAASRWKVVMSVGYESCPTTFILARAHYMGDCDKHVSKEIYSHTHAHAYLK